MSLLGRGQRDQVPQESIVAARSQLTATGLKKALPLVALQLYLTITLLTYLYGPWQYPNNGMREAALWALAYQVAIAVGYIYGTLLYHHPRIKPLPLAVTHLSILSTLLMFLPTSLAMTGSLIPNPLAGITNPGELYARSLALADDRISIVIQYFRILMAYFLSALIPLTLMNWHQLTKNYKWLAAMALLSTPLIYLSAGINKGVGETLIFLPLMGALLYFRRMQSVGGILRAVLSTITVILLGLIVFLPLFGGNITSRKGAGIQGGYGYFPVGPVVTNPYHPLISILPESLKPSAVALTGYVTQGYYAISLAEHEDFTPMYGIGNSTFLSRQVERIEGFENFGDSSYPAKIEKYGWDRYVYWSTAYLWWASDVGLPGVAIVCFFIGMLFSNVWHDFLYRKSTQSFVLLYYLAIMFVYISSNNQIGQSGELLFGFIATLFVWMYSRSKIYFKI